MKLRRKYMYKVSYMVMDYSVVSPILIVERLLESGNQDQEPH